MTTGADAVRTSAASPDEHEHAAGRATSCPMTALDPFIVRRTTEVVLRDGLRVILRPIVPDDREHLMRGYEALSKESRVRRFVAPPSHLTDGMLTYLTEVDYVDHFAVVALAVDESGEHGVGVARYVRLQGQPELAEAAVTVLDAYQGRGVGSLLLQAVAMTALENGIRQFAGYVLWDNEAVLDMCRRFGGNVAADSPGMARVVIDLPAQAEELRGTPLHSLLRALARGELGFRVHEARPDGVRWRALEAPRRG